MAWNDADAIGYRIPVAARRYRRFSCMIEQPTMPLDAHFFVRNKYACEKTSTKKSMENIHKTAFFIL